MTYIDDLIGDVLKSLVENGFGDNTIVTLIGDHGWMLGENQVGTLKKYFRITYDLNHIYAIFLAISKMICKFHCVP